MAETESAEHDSAYGQLIIGNIVLPAPRSRLCGVKLTTLDRIIW